MEEFQFSEYITLPRIKYQWFSLKEAVVHGNMDKVKMQLKNPRDANLLLNRYGATLLCHAIESQQNHIVQFLLTGYTNIITIEWHGHLFLKKAIGSGNDKAVHYLLEAGCKVSDTLDNRYTPLMMASNMGQVKSMTHLLKYGADIDAKNKAGQTALTLAVASHQLLVVKCLLAWGANLETKDNLGLTPLFSFGIPYHRCDVLRFLVQEAGANVNITLHKNNMPSLLYVCKQGHTGLLKLLLDAGVSIHQRDIHGYTPLGMASMHGHEGCVEILLKAGAHVDTPSTHNQMTPLALACFQGGINVVNLLLKANANVEAMDSKGETPLYYAHRNPYPHMVSYMLLHAGANPNHSQAALRPLNAYGPICHVNMLEAYIKSGALLDTTNNEGLTPLHSCVKANLVVQVGMLCQAGARAFLTCFPYGNTPLHYATADHNLLVVKALLIPPPSSHWDVSFLHIKNKLGRTALHLLFSS